MSVTQGALNGSANAAHSVASSVPGSATSAGASRVIADLLRDLDVDFNDRELIELAMEDHKMKHQRKLNLLAALSHEAVAGPRRPPSKKPWTVEASTAAWIVQAALCSRAVYHKERDGIASALEGYTVQDTFWTEPSQDGKVKSAALFQINKIDPETEKQQRTTLVVAVRGSVSQMDWLVNINSKATLVPDLVEMPSTKDSPPLVHRGFAECARILAPIVEEQVQAALVKLHDTGQEADLVFTGHSAGGAVAALLYCRFRTRRAQGTFLLSSKPSLSCITFGAPPMLSKSIESHLEQVDSDKNAPYAKGLRVAFIAEGDPIPRMDTDYAMKLATLYSQVGGGASISMHEIGRFRPIPLRMHSVGKMVMLWDGNEESEDLQLKATEIDQYYLHSCAWGNMFAHKLDETYIVWTSRLGLGKFNGRVGHKPEKSGKSGFLRKILPLSK